MTDYLESQMLKFMGEKFTERTLQELLKQNLLSNFQLDHMTSTDDFHWFHFDLKCHPNDAQFSIDIQKASDIFQTYFTSLSSNYLVSTKIPYRELGSLSPFNYANHQNDSFDKFKHFIKNTGKAYFAYFDIEKDAIFFKLDENFIKKITIIGENFQFALQFINCHEQFTATELQLVNTFLIYLLDSEYLFHAENTRSPMTGNYVFRSKKEKDVIYFVSLLQERSELIQDLSSILEKELQENELTSTFAKNSNKLNRLLRYLLHMNYAEGEFFTDDKYLNIKLKTDIIGYDILLNYFQHNYELINRVAHERIMTLFEENGRIHLRLDHPFFQAEQFKQPLIVNYKNPSPNEYIGRELWIDFSLPSKKENLLIGVTVPEIALTNYSKRLKFELVPR